MTDGIANYDAEIERQHEPAIVFPDPPELEPERVDKPVEEVDN